MRLLTGKHRREHEALVVDAAADATSVSHLRDEVGRLCTQLKQLRQDFEYERDRANQASDALLISKGHPPITPPKPDATDWDALFDEDLEELKALKTRMDAGQPVMGEAKGQ